MLNKLIFHILPFGQAFAVVWANGDPSLGLFVGVTTLLGLGLIKLITIGT